MFIYSGILTEGELLLPPHLTVTRSKVVYMLTLLNSRWQYAIK